MALTLTHSLARRVVSKSRQATPSSLSNACRHPIGALLLLLLGLVGIPSLKAQPGMPVDPVSVSNLTALTNLVASITTLPTTNEQIAAFRLQKTNAWHAVEAIVSRPPLAYRRSPQMRVSTVNAEWYHPGAEHPNFNRVDVRQTQRFPYADAEYITSDRNPGLVFRGVDLEFNSMTKLFITNRAFPCRKLSQAEMLEINRLYRIIGRCHDEIERLEHPEKFAPPPANPAKTESSAPSQPQEGMSRISQQTLILYGGIAAGALVVLMILIKLLKKKA